PHIPTEVEAICERVIIIASGRIGLNQRLDEIESENVIHLDARGPADKMTHALQGLHGVVSVKALPVDDGVARYEIRTAEDKDMREEVSHAIAGKGWTIRGLDRKSRRLADAFFEILRVDDPLAKAAEPAK